MHAVLRIGDRWRKQEPVIVTSLQPMPAIEQHRLAFATPDDPEVIRQMAALFREHLSLNI